VRAAHCGLYQEAVRLAGRAVNRAFISHDDVPRRFFDFRMILAEAANRINLISGRRNRGKTSRRQRTDDRGQPTKQGAWGKGEEEHFVRGALRLRSASFEERCA
jgi:hypothetical protein